MSINFELLDGAVKDAAEGAHGYQHYQADWVCVPEGAELAEQCGTAMCLAGFIAVREGVKVPEPRRWPADGEWYYPEWWVNSVTGDVDDGYHEAAVLVATYATRKAGLDTGQADALFYGGNTLDDIRTMIDHLRANPDASLAELHALVTK